MQAVACDPVDATSEYFVLVAVDICEHSCDCLTEACKAARVLICRMKLFLYNTSTREMMGVFEAVSQGGTHDPYGRIFAWLLLSTNQSTPFAVTELDV